MENLISTRQVSQQTSQFDFQCAGAIRFLKSAMARMDGPSNGYF